MKIDVLWRSGSIETFDSTYFSSADGAGWAWGNIFLDLSDPYGIGIVAMTRAVPFGKNEFARFADGAGEQKILIDADAVGDLMLLKVDGNPVLMRASLDEAGNPFLDFTAELSHMLLPKRSPAAPADAVQVDAETGEVLEGADSEPDEEAAGEAFSDESVDLF